MKITYDPVATAHTGTASTAGTATFGPDKVRAFGLVGIMVALSATAHDFDSLSRLKIKGSSETYVDLLETHYAAYFQRFSQSNHDIASADVRFLLALFLPDADDPMEKFMCGFPPNETITVEISQDGTPSANPVTTLGLMRRDDGANIKFRPSFLGVQMGIAASTTGTHPLNGIKGLIRAIVFNTTGLTSARLVLGGEVVIDDCTAADILAMQTDENVDADVDPLCIKLEPPRVAINGDYLRITAAAGWAGATNECSTFAIVEI